jgi:ADP-ribosylglycohydrolase
MQAARIAPDATHDRAHGAMFGVALGDAMGMPSQTLSRAAIRATYGRITGFVEPFAQHPVSHGLRAGQVTDDTEQTMLLAARIVADPTGFDNTAWAQSLMNWEADVRRRGLRDLLGPSTKAALQDLMAGVPASQTGRNGTTNGAAMRIVPIGIATPPDAALLVNRVAAVCAVTHATGEAIGAAAAVAMIISMGIEGADFETAIPAALDAARLGNRQGAAKGETDMAGRIAFALAVAAQGDEADLATRIGTSVASRESVAAAFGVVRLAGGDPWAAAVIAANIGDDTDTIGAIAVGMAGACRGLAAFPPGEVEHLCRLNSFDPGLPVAALLAVRAGPKYHWSSP